MSALGERLYSKQEASEILGISIWTLDRILRAGEIGRYTIGRRTRLAERHIEAYLQSAEKTPPRAGQVEVEE